MARAFAKQSELLTVQRYWRPERRSRPILRSAVAVVLLSVSSVPLLALTGAAAAPAVINVPGDQPTIQAAVQAASSGDTILLAPGTHQGGVWVQDKWLTFASWYQTTSDRAYIAQTVISGYVSNVCGGASGCAGNAVIEFGSRAHGSAVTGLTITNGVDGVRSSSRVDVSHSHMTANEDGADFSNDSGGTFSDNVFANNSDDGIDLNGRVDLRIIGNTIQDNGDDGIEFRMYPYSGPILTVDISGNRFIHNDSDGIQLIDSPDASSRVVPDVVPGPVLAATAWSRRTRGRLRVREGEPSLVVTQVIGGFDIPFAVPPGGHVRRSEAPGHHIVEMLVDVRLPVEFPYVRSPVARTGVAGGNLALGRCHRGVARGVADITDDGEAKVPTVVFRPGVRPEAAGDLVINQRLLR